MALKRGYSCVGLAVGGAVFSANVYVGIKDIARHDYAAWPVMGTCLLGLSVFKGSIYGALWPCTSRGLQMHWLLNMHTTLAELSFRVLRLKVDEIGLSR